MHTAKALSGLLAFSFVVGCQPADKPSIPPRVSNLQSSGPEDRAGTVTPISVASEEVDSPRTVTNNPSAEPPSYIRPFSIVMYDRAQEEHLKPFAERVANLLGIDNCQSFERNPVCCVWLEITGWTPSPGDRGYVINNQPGGSLIQASDVEQMRLAVERLESVAKQYEDHVEVPAGILTSYSINR